MYTSRTHHELNELHANRLSKSISKLLHIFESCNPWNIENDSLVNVVTKQVILVEGKNAILKE